MTASASPPSAAGSEAPGSSRSPRVLIIDDDPFMVRLLGGMLARLGDFEIHGESDPAQALAKLPELARDTDGMILDINMPGVDGIELFRHLSLLAYGGCLVLCSGEGAAMLESTVQLARSRGLHVLGGMCKPPRLDELRGFAQACRSTPQPDARPASDWYPTQAELRRAVADGAIECHYQPKVALGSGALVGVEALARLRHPRHGLVPPGHFIGLAERCGAIGEITKQVFEQTFTQLARWQAEGIDLSLGVNASARDFGDLDFVDFVDDCAQRHGVRPDRVVIEVTESSLGDDPHLLVEVMTRLRLRRFGLSIDDFGNGYSTLTKLRDVVFDEIKIDHGFTHAAHESLRSEVIFDASVTLGQRLGMRVAAEGVEDRLDWDFCRAHGAEVAQGFFIARAMPGSALAAWREQWAGRVRAERLAEPAAR